LFGVVTAHHGAIVRSDASMSMWKNESLAGLVVRSAGTAGAPPLWFVHALGDSSRAFAAIADTVLGSLFHLYAPDLPGSGATPADRGMTTIDAIADRVARAIDEAGSVPSVALVGHSLGAAIGGRAVRKVRCGVSGLFSIEGNLTEEDAYFSGQAARFARADEFKQHLLGQIDALAGNASPAREPSLRRYHSSLAASDPEMLWAIGRDAAAASAGDALGAEYRALTIPTWYYWSPANTPVATQQYVRRHRLANESFSGGHWPTIENPSRVAESIRRFLAR
jgi:pimeloyl-ACP methyl ester carboxylesterase